MQENKKADENIVLYNVLNKTTEKLREVIKRKEKIQIELTKKREELIELIDFQHKLEMRMEVLQEIIDDSYATVLKSDSMEISPEIITEAVIKGGASITSPLHPEKLLTTDIYLNKLSIADEAARQIAKELERNVGGKNNESN